jgi:hypothetical protein
MCRHLVNVGTSFLSPSRKELVMTQTLVRADNPTLEAAMLRASLHLVAKIKRAEATQYQVWMANDGGYFQLNWSETITGSYDWVGLYPNDTVPDTDYIDGNNWQWATRGNSYKTSTPAQPGYQVRYLVWDANAGQYTSVARGNLR